MSSAWLTDAVEQGVEIGLIQSAAEDCPARLDHSKCPMNPSEGCACAWIQHRQLPFWKRIFSTAPPRPAADIALRYKIDRAIIAELHKLQPQEQAYVEHVFPKRDPSKSAEVD